MVSIAAFFPDFESERFGFRTRWHERPQKRRKTKKRREATSRPLGVFCKLKNQRKFADLKKLPAQGSNLQPGG